MILPTIIALIQSYGYVIIFVFTLLEGETVVALAGFVAYQGYLNIYYVVLVAIVGAVIGDQAYFYFGRLKGKQFIAARPKLQQRLGHVHGLIVRHQNWLMFGSRFMYGFRVILPIAFGTSGIRRSKFLLFNFMGATVWAIFFSFGGYAFGNGLEHFIGNVKRAEKFIIIGVIAGIVLVQVILFLRRRIVAKLEKAEKKAEVELGEIKE